jgi:hypothetical protein
MIKPSYAVFPLATDCTSGSDFADLLRAPPLLRLCMRPRWVVWVRMYAVRLDAGESAASAPPVPRAPGAAVVVARQMLVGTEVSALGAGLYISPICAAPEAGEPDAPSPTVMGAVHRDCAR